MAGPMEWLLGRRVSRVTLTALLFPLPLLAVVSAAIAVLTASTQSWRIALVDAALSAALLMLLTVLVDGPWIEMGIGAGLTWGVAVLLGHLSRVTSLNLAVQSAVLLGFAGAMIFLVVSRDPQAYWEQVLGDLAERARSAGLEVGPADLLPMAAQLMTGLMSASAIASALGALFLGVWWAGPVGGRSFGEEFQGLRMGRVLGVLAGVIGVLALTGLKPSVDDLLLVLGVGFIVQGLAVVHWHGARHEWPKVWPLALYLPLALVPALAVIEMLLLALVGLVDNAYRLRRSGDKSGVM